MAAPLPYVYVYNYIRTYMYVLGWLEGKVAMPHLTQYLHNIPHFKGKGKLEERYLQAEGTGLECPLSLMC